MNFIFQFLVGAIFAISTSPSAADPKWYNDVYPSNKNSQISLLNQGGGSVTAIRNPTAASVQLNANTSTQPPSVFVQATATLPVASIGASCDPAKNTAGLSSSDRLTILVCPPTGLWTISNRTRLRQVNENDPCDPALDGNLAVNSTGLTLSCQSGSPPRWARAAGTATGWKLVDGAPCPIQGGWVPSGAYVGFNLCAAGTWILTVDPNNYSG
ncbi:MAG: hypothetical protein J0I91_19410 [Candidatus Accumulibacter sp.]|nr:hypothetical protein [Accumulibacter sp.]